MENRYNGGDSLGVRDNFGSDGVEGPVTDSIL